MLTCKKCKKELPDGAIFCLYCGKRQVEGPSKRRRTRGNGTGTIYQMPNLNYLEKLRNAPIPIDKSATFATIYHKWTEIHEQDVSKSTMGCYSVAYKYYRPIWYIPLCEIGIDDLQECLDECPKGKRTRQNMKAFGTLIYDYALPRDYLSGNLNLAKYVKIRGEDSVTREAFSDLEIEKIRQSIGAVPYADYIYCQIYWGFRPHEFQTLDITNYNRVERCFIGGSKTEAGTDRTVTISPKIQKVVDRLIGNRTSGPVFGDPDGNSFDDKKYRELCFYPALDAIGIDNPKDPQTGSRRLTPHCCRHTFATLMNRVKGSDKVKLELIGHTSDEMLRHYQHVSFDDLRTVTNAI